MACTLPTHHFLTRQDTHPSAVSLLFIDCLFACSSSLNTPADYMCQDFSARCSVKMLPMPFAVSRSARGRLVPIMCCTFQRFQPCVADLASPLVATPAWCLLLNAGGRWRAHALTSPAAHRATPDLPRPVDDGGPHPGSIQLRLVVTHLQLLRG